MENKRIDFSQQLLKLSNTKNVLLEQVEIEFGNWETTAIYAAKLYIPISGDEIRVMFFTNNQFDEECHFGLRYDLACKTDFDLEFKTVQKAYDYACMVAAVINAAWSIDRGGDFIYWAFYALFGEGVLIGDGRTTGMTAAAEKKTAKKVDTWIVETSQYADDGHSLEDAYRFMDLAADQQTFYDIISEVNLKSGGWLF